MAIPMVCSRLGLFAVVGVGVIMVLLCYYHEVSVVKL